MNKMKSICLIMIVLFCFSALSGEVLTTLTEVMKPQWLAVDDTRFYVTEGARVFIYARDDFHLVTQFGKEGNGPEEFSTAGGQMPLIVFPHDDKLQINSLNRITFYTKDGNYLEMIKSTAGVNFIFRPVLPDNYVARGVAQEEGVVYNTIDLFDGELQKIRELVRIKRGVQRSGPIRLFSDRITFETYEDKIFLQSAQDFLITVLNNKGEKLYEVKKPDYDRLKFTQDFENELYETLERDPRQRQFIPVLKQRAQFPSHLPAIASLMVADSYLYTITWQHDEDKFECFVFEAATGKELKKSYIPFQRPSPLAAYPSSVKDGILYQLVENVDEEWDLTAVKLN